MGQKKKTTSPKIIIFIVIGISLWAVWFYLSKSREPKIIQEQWNILLQSKEADSETSAIKLLTETVSKQNGYREVIGITKNNSKVNMIGYDSKLDDLTSFEVIFYWKDKRFHGKNWIPVNKENIYLFFEDE